MTRQTYRQALADLAIVATMGLCAIVALLAIADIRGVL